MMNYYIIDIRDKFRRNPYITLWRPNNAGYCYPLPWAGQYSEQQVIDGEDYYTSRKWDEKTQQCSGDFERFAVRVDLVQPLLISPALGMIDGDVGPVIANTPENRAALLELRFVAPMQVLEGCGA